MAGDGIDWEQRIAPRRQVNGDAVIIAPGMARTACTIRDLSATGAKLGIAHAVKLPNEFDLLLVKANTVRRVIMRWRDGDFAGVQFRSSSHSLTADK